MKRLLFITALGIALIASPLFADEGKDESGKGKEGKQYSEKSYRDHQGGGESYFHQHGYDRLNIPKGHYPPPGECRIWFPNRPAGQQPPPIKCGEPVPPGAWLIQHPNDIPREHVTVTVYEPQRPGIIHAVGEFDIGSGMFIRVILDKHT
ncbi:MAG: hypothetical protein KKA54_08120 [Proteobacteria bacterium]|nr:hypothetical protein [Pseudomonadota bacterium]MBU0966331.1 hypothetical protein [Pseudomonadota bacterium]